MTVGPEVTRVRPVWSDPPSEPPPLLYAMELAYCVKLAYQFRRAHLPDGKRERRVLDAVAKKAGWGSAPPAGHAWGIARHTAFLTEAAEIAEVTIVDRRIRVTRVWCAVDCGIVVNPDIVRSQVEGGILFGLSAASQRCRADEDRAVAGARAFATVARVLQSPRCMNCHPAGDRPLQGDTGRPHRMWISRASVDAGLPCSTCHQERNSEAVGVIGGPPGAPHWGLPPKETPMVFQGKTLRALCEQLKVPAQTGGKDLAALLHHVENDALVLWGWTPGGKRRKPPVAHAAFVDAFRTWVASDGACP